MYGTKSVRDWEAVFGRWAQPPGKSEEDRCENAVGAIRNAIGRSPALCNRGVKVFVQGYTRYPDAAEALGQAATPAALEIVGGSR